MTLRRIAARWRLPTAILLAAVTWQITSLYASAGLDPSWRVALHLTWTDDIHFGPGFAWTYGPLGFLAFPIAAGSGTLVAAFFFVALGQATLAYVLLRRTARAFTAAGAVVVGYVVLGLPSAPADFLLLILLVLAVWALDDPDGVVAGWFPLAGGVLAGLTALTKTNTGIAAVGIAVVAAAGLAAEDRRALATPGVVLATFLAGWMLCGESLGDLPGWLRLSASLVSGYSAAMQYEQPQLHDEYLIALVLLLLVLALVVSRAVRLGRVRGTALVLVVAVLGLAFFKEGFVRHDAAHSASFFAAFSIAAVALAGRDLSRVLAVVCVAICVWATLRSHQLDYAPVASTRHAASQLTDVVVPHRRHNLVAGSHVTEQHSYQVPARLVAKLKGHTVHVDPFETAAVSGYGLLWRPLPIVQAYSAYTSRLDLANAAFLRSANAPQRILRENTMRTINMRGRELEAPAEFRALLCNYEQIGVSQGWQVLAHITPRCVNSYRIKSVRAPAGVPVPVPQARANEIVIARIRTGDSLFNHVRSFFWKPLAPYISLGGGPFVQLIAATAPDGIVVHVPATAGFDPRFGGAIDWTTVAVGGRPGAIRIDFDAVPMVGAAPKPAGERSQRPLPGYRLQNVGGADRIVAPGGAVLPVAPGGGFVDYAYTQRTSLVLRGWSADVAAGIPSSTILVYADGKLVFAGSPNTRRPDVAAALGHPRLAASGYALLVPLVDVRSGRRRRHVRVFSVVAGKVLELSYPTGYGWR